MKIADYGRYEVHVPTTGGKAGKGRNKTTTLQLRRGDCIVKQFRPENKSLPMKTHPLPKPDNTSAFQREMAATKTIHDALLTVSPDRRGAIIGAIAILLQIHIPRPD